MRLPSSSFSLLTENFIFWVAVFLLFHLETVTSFSHLRNRPEVRIRQYTPSPGTELFVSTNPSQHDAQEKRKAESLERGHHPLMSLNLNLDSLAQGGAASRAQELLERIEALYQEGYYAISPDVVSYNSVLHAWTKNNKPEKALELLRSLEQRRDKAADNAIDCNTNNTEANVISYNTVIHAFAQNGLYQEAEELLRRMQNNDENGGVVPDTITYNSVLYAYAQSTDIDAPPKAEALLREMMTEENEAQVDTMSFNIVLHAWAQSKQERAPHRAQELLEHMEALSAAGNSKVKPDVYSYSIVIQAYVSQLRDQRRRHEQKRRGNQFDKAQPKISSNTFTARTAKKILKKMEAQQLQPNQVTYTSVMMALCWSGWPQDAHKLLLDLLKKYEEQKEIVGRSPAASSMLVKPDTIAFSAVMDGWVKNAYNFPDATERVIELFEIMKYWQAQGHDDMAPNGRTYTSVISALAKSRTWDACLEAKALLEEIPGEGATVIHYNAVLDAFAKSPRADKARHAKALLEEMTKRNDDGGGSLINPDIISYNSVLNACAASFGSPELKKEALATAMSVFTRICQSEELEPSPYTFTVMMKALRKLIANEETIFSNVGKIFQLCCKRGMLNSSVWQQVQKCIPPHKEETAVLWRQLIGEDIYYPGIQLSELPPEWRCNCKIDLHRQNGF